MVPNILLTPIALFRHIISLPDCVLLVLQLLPQRTPEHDPSRVSARAKQVHHVQEAPVGAPEETKTFPSAHILDNGESPVTCA